VARSLPLRVSFVNSPLCLTGLPGPFDGEPFGIPLVPGHFRGDQLYRCLQKAHLGHWSLVFPLLRPSLRSFRRRSPAPPAPLDGCSLRVDVPFPLESWPSGKPFGPPPPLPRTLIYSFFFPLREIFVLAEEFLFGPYRLRPRPLLGFFQYGVLPFFFTTSERSVFFSDGIFYSFSTSFGWEGFRHGVFSNITLPHLQVFYSSSPARVFPLTWALFPGFCDPLVLFPFPGSSLLCKLLPCPRTPFLSEQLLELSFSDGLFSSWQPNYQKEGRVPPLSSLLFFPNVSRTLRSFPAQRSVLRGRQLPDTALLPPPRINGLFWRLLRDGARGHRRSSTGRRSVVR